MITSPIPYSADPTPKTPATTPATPGPYSGDPAASAPPTPATPAISGADILRRVEDVNSQIRESYQRGNLGPAAPTPIASPASVNMVQRAKDTSPADNARGSVANPDAYKATP